MQSSSFENYKAKKIFVIEALYDGGRSARKQEEYERANRIFSPINQRATARRVSSSKPSFSLPWWPKIKGIMTVPFRYILNICIAFPDDHNCALVNFRMGHLLRIKWEPWIRPSNNFHTVISITTRMIDIEELSACNGKHCLKAKIEIAKTYRDDGQFEKAGRLYKRLLSQQHGDDDLGISRRSACSAFRRHQFLFLKVKTGRKSSKKALIFWGCIGTISRHPKYDFRMAKAYLNQGLDDEAAYQFNDHGKHHGPSARGSYDVAAAQR